MPATMSGELRIQTFDELSNIGAKLKTEATEQTAHLETIRAMADPAGIWDGPAAAQYEEAFLRWKEAQRQMLESLNQMGNFLEGAANAYRDANQSVMNSLGLGPAGY